MYSQQTSDGKNIKNTDNAPISLDMISNKKTHPTSPAYVVFHSFPTLSEFELFFRDDNPQHCSSSFPI